MKKLILIISLIIISCNSQTKKENKKTNMENNNYEDTLYNGYVPLMKDFLKDNNFKFLNEEVFNKKVSDLFGVDVKKSKFDDVVPCDLDIPNVNAFIRNERFIDFYELDRGVIDGAGDALKDMLTKDRNKEDLFILYNKILLNDDISTLPYILKDTFHLEHIVVYFNYEKNNFLNNSLVKTIKTINDYPDNFKIQLLWYNDRNKSEIIRKQLLSDLLTKNSEFIFDLTYFLFLNKNKVIQKKDQRYINQTLAYLIDIQLKHYGEDLASNKGYSLLNNFYVQNEMLLKDFKKNSFYNYNELKDATDTFNILSLENQTSSVLIYKIQDADGFTNLRSENDTQSPVIAKINTGTQIEVLDDKGNWWYVQTPDGKKGYIHKSKIVSE